MSIHKVIESYDFNHLKLSTRLSEIGDIYDIIYLVIKCEESFEVNVFDDEMGILFDVNPTVGEFGEYFNFIKTGEVSKFVSGFISEKSDSLSKWRSDLIALIRDDKLEKLFRS